MPGTTLFAQASAVNCLTVLVPKYCRGVELIPENVTQESWTVFCSVCVNKLMSTYLIPSTPPMFE